MLWFRTDLRVNDHEALTRAVAVGPLLAVYCIDPRHFRETRAGFPKTGAFRARFLHESLLGLRAQLRELGGDLLVREGKPETVLPVLLRDAGMTELHITRVVGTEEAAVEHNLRCALANIGVTLGVAEGHMLIHPDDLPFEPEALPDVFTRFRNLVERALIVRAPLPPPARISTHPYAQKRDMIAETDAALDRLKQRTTAVTESERARLSYNGGAPSGHARLKRYVWDADRLRVYKETRNGLLAADDSSKLSPWLALGCLSPREIYAEVQRYEHERVRNDSTYWLFVELLWRDYFQLVARKAGAALFRVGGLQRLALPWRNPARDAAARRDFELWRRGETGFPLVDACMRELAATGYMSNRGRQIVASFLTKNLNIDWRWGAAWFESLLIDYDVACNYGNWLYAAGVGNDARGFRFFNVYKQGQDYDSDGAFTQHWLPELAMLRGASLHKPDGLPRTVREHVNYPEPIVDLFESARRNEVGYNAAVNR